jgi:2-aminoethylphosphonate-pyruvate transaminase
MDADYLLLTPGPLSTTATVRAAMDRDVSTWDIDYNTVVEQIRSQLVSLVSGDTQATSVLMQGSGTFGVEATLGTVVPRTGGVLVVNNGAYGARMLEIAGRLEIPAVEVAFGETEPASADSVAAALESNPQLTHVAAVHCETTSGMLNPIPAIGQVVAQAGRSFIVDAMSSFGGMPMTLQSLSADYLISSSNKCIQGVPGFCFVLARPDAIAATAGQARSLSLDLHAQWAEMEAHHGKWRFTSPTHTVLAFAQALEELEAEGGVAARARRYTRNQRRLVEGMREIGFQTLLDDDLQSPIITAFRDPVDNFDFATFYDLLKGHGFVIYPGKVTQANTFRIGTIGDVHAEDIERLLAAVAEVSGQMGLYSEIPATEAGP